MLWISFEKSSSNEKFQCICKANSLSLLATLLLLRAVRRNVHSSMAATLFLTSARCRCVINRFTTTTQSLSIITLDIFVEQAQDIPLLIVSSSGQIVLTTNFIYCNLPPSTNPNIFVEQAQEIPLLIASSLGQIVLTTNSIYCNLPPRTNPSLSRAKIPIPTLFLSHAALTLIFIKPVGGFSHLQFRIGLGINGGFVKFVKTKFITKNFCALPNKQGTLFLAPKKQIIHVVPYIPK